MYIVASKHDGQIIETFSTLEVIDGKWIRSSFGSLMQLDMVDVVEVENTPEGKNYYHNKAFHTSAKEDHDKQREDITKALKTLDNPRDAEDIFQVLKAKGILADEDIPATTLARFNEKKELRQRLSEL